MQKRACQVRVFGRVQGVFLRRFLRERAQTLGLVGWVKNAESENEVNCFAQGHQDMIDQFLAACASGSRLARVERVEVEKAEYNPLYCDFIIK